MKLIDTHCHLDLEGYPDNLEEIIEDTKQQLDKVINVGCCIPSSKANLELAEKHPFIYAAVGVHPNYCNDYNGNDEKALESMLMNPKVVALGEIGLDYYRDYVTPKKQQEVFRKQLAIAKKYNKPIIIHGREAYTDIFSILAEDEFKTITGVMHSYAGTFDEVEHLLDRFYISLSGMVTFKKATQVHEVAKKIPLNRLLIETDAPFLTPVPFRGKEKNKPSYVKYVAEEIARIKEKSFDEIVKTTHQNSLDLFEF